MPPSDASIIESILLLEGDRYTDDPADSGGPTKWGITMPTLSVYRGHPVTATDIQQLSREEASEIYVQRYIRPFDGLPVGLRENVIDMAVNAGLSRATRLLQQLIGATVDGVLGPETLRKAMDGAWNDGYAYFRLAFYEALIERSPKNQRWRNGWRNRAFGFLMVKP